MPRSFSSRLANAYGHLWSDLGITHQLTISLGVSPRAFSPEEELMPILRKLVREGATKLRGLPKRRALLLTHNDPQALGMAGFYEATKRSGESFPHWHGGVALHPGEELGLRQLLWQCIGEDAQDPLERWEPSKTTRPLITIRGAKPTFHLTPLVTSARFASYANKKTPISNIVHWTTADILA